MLSGYTHVDRRTGTVSYGSYPTVSAQSLEAWSTALHNRAHPPNWATQPTAGRSDANIHMTSTSYCSLCSLPPAAADFFSLDGIKCQETAGPSSIPRWSSF